MEVRYADADRVPNLPVTQFSSWLWFIVLNFQCYNLSPAAPSSALHVCGCIHDLLILLCPLELCDACELYSQVWLIPYSPPFATARTFYFPSCLCFLLATQYSNSWQSICYRHPSAQGTSLTSISPCLLSCLFSWFCIDMMQIYTYLWYCANNYVTHKKPPPR